MTRHRQDPFAQSVKQRLMNRARRDGEDFNLLLTRYAIERLLYRLTRTPHNSRFTLKGAMLFAIWMDKPHRPTLDVDLLVGGEPSADDLRKVFQEVCDAAVEPDGMRFDAASVQVEAIREDNVYQGLRVKLIGRLGSARLPVQVDVGIGDVITPAPAMATFGPLLDLPPPVMAAYLPQTVIAEKLEAMVTLGMANSRMKDFFDLYVLSRTMDSDGQALVDAVGATFRRRRTAIPRALPLALTPDFAADPAKRAQWAAFARRIDAGQRPADFAEVVEAIARFVGPALSAAVGATPFLKTWRAGGPWRDRSPAASDRAGD
ncbi:MAG: nucleotidyl transferase AbiEii/AbiGii toxin family protein [Phycisphaerales bacterium]|nr:nucleotidyl transferase AbiEii/AbiGii toxin family protein [Phycisphaerales bacterium]